MKKNNIKQLKKWMVNRSTDKIECYVCGVQAYNISANEYEVIVAYQKINGRYYFVDRDGNKYLASRYDRAEQVAGDIVENVNDAVLSVMSSCNELQTQGHTTILEDLTDLFLEFSTAIGLEFEVKEISNSENGEVTVIYILKGNKTPEQQSEETAADEQNNENEENAAACEPSMFVGILAKVKNSAQAAAEKAGFVISLVIIFAVGLLSVCVAVSSVASIVEALGLLGSLWGALLGSVLVLTVGLDFMAFVVINAMAILSRFFPSEFEKAQKPKFTKPFSFWYRLISESL